ncbi:PTS transporter subunit EIIA [Agaribacter marinus]|uniref:BglG family transcription antiterminator n=1 Tax=Virgibacillus salarius TaxID=447199 RepID=A0A941IA45_9BACI|nr:BglG family transcription antiterminator [Virgibacillus salarius]MBR7796263.1 BglG family transcription antiterminator [Virgibacillus salarius]NAZ08971.1 PTS transporter subunit EIIA [Agaribacter marinus]
MVLDKRRAYLLSIVMKECKPIHTRRLSELLGVSQRTIYYDLDQLNNWLTEQCLEPIQNCYGKGVYLVDKTRKELIHQGIIVTDDYAYQFSEQERKLLLTIRLLTDNEPSTMRGFMDMTNMSRSSVIKDIKHVKAYLSKHYLRLHYTRPIGYQVDGSEEQKRRLVAHILSYTLLQKESDIFQKKIYQILNPFSKLYHQADHAREAILAIIHEAECELGLTLTDEMVEMLLIQLLVVVKRVKAEQIVAIDIEEKNVLRQSVYFHAAQFISNRLTTKYQLEIPDDEICFLTMSLLGLKVHHDDFRNYTERELRGLQRVVHRMVSEFQNNACVIFDDRDGLERNLISHIKPTYYRLKYDVKYSNHLTESIRKNYEEIYHFTKQVIVHLEYYVGKQIPEDEIAYISLHFGGWLKKEKKQVNVNYRAIIVCENGIGTSNMLKTQLESLIVGLDVVAVQSIREFNQQHHQVDVIFSTNYLKEKDIPVIHVAPILSNHDKERILMQVNDMFNIETVTHDETNAFMEIIARFASIRDPIGLQETLKKMLQDRTHHVKEIRKPMLNELLTEKTIQFRDHVSNWQEAIKVAAEPLVLQRAIKPTYVKEMIDNVKEMGPYIVLAPNIALPHARPETGVERLGMSFLRLKEPVYFSAKEKHRAQLIIVLAAIDNETHLTALSQLTDLLSVEENVQQLIASENIQDVQNIINQINLI